MALPSAADLVALLRQLPLLAPGQLDDLTRKIDTRTLDSRALGQKLIEHGYLSPFQVNQLLQGRGPDLVLGSYVLMERLGEGGMGEVFKARHQKMNRVVAIKLIRKERLANEAAVKRFRREIRSAALLSHPNIVHALDADQVRATHLFAMEYIEGVDLNKLVKEKGPLPVPQACDYIRQAALGLQHAYEKGMVHRDIKPHNLLRTTSGEVKVLDFGLARLAGDDDSSTLTQEGSMMGTLDYVAPEQARNSHNVDIRADLYSLGCTLYFLLTGQVPFPGGEALEKLYKHGFETAPPVEKLRHDVPPGVAAIVRKLLAKKPEDRFQTPAELAAALAKGGVARSPRRRRLLLAGAAGIGILGLGLLVAVLSSRSGNRALAQATVPGSATIPGASQPKEGVLENSLGMKLKLIGGGTFTMGSAPEEIERTIQLKLPWIGPEQIRGEGPAHTVEISQPFYLGVTPVTRGQFAHFIANSSYKIPRGASRHGTSGSWALDPTIDWGSPGYPCDDNSPVTCVNWADATEFVKWLNVRHPLRPPGARPHDEWTYTLPSEAQWEYACRAGTRTRFFCGDSDNSLQGFANVADASFAARFRMTDWARGAASWDDGHVFPTPVGSFKPNPWGLHDMHGNVWQWCADPYAVDYYSRSPVRDPPGATHNGHFVMRGGSWASGPGLCRAAHREGVGSGLRRDNFGFRVALVRLGR